MQTLSFYYKNPKILGNVILNRFCRWMPDEAYLRIKYRMWMGKPLDLRNPRTFGEKLEWLKLYNRKPEYTILVDKVKVKDYVAPIIGERYLIPTLGVWDDPEKIDFDSLPDRFVIKCNHNSGLGMYICKDKSKMDVEKVKSGLMKGLKQDYYIASREWPYKNVPRRILAEQFIDPPKGSQDLPDYKWYCFNGEPKFCQVIQDRNTCETIDFFDVEWRHQNFIGLNKKAGNAKITPSRPAHIEEHLAIARKLSKGIPFARIDLYETEDRPYFGEVTFFPNGGFGSFRPAEYNEILGSMICLPK